MCGGLSCAVVGCHGNGNKLRYSFKAEVPNHRVATHYQAVKEFLPGREKVLGKMCIDMTLCYLLCVNDFSNYSVFSLYVIDIE